MNLKYTRISISFPGMLVLKFNEVDLFYRFKFSSYNFAESQLELNEGRDFVVHLSSRCLIYENLWSCDHLKFKNHRGLDIFININR